MRLFLHEIIRYLNLPISNQNIEITGYAIDSRCIKSGDLFFALKGMKSDGHDYLYSAKEKGAIAAVIESDYSGPIPENLEILRVVNVKRQLQQLAKAVAATLQGQVIAITGSLGKTTAKDFLAHILSQHYQIYKTPHSYNSQLTLPLTILEADNSADYFVIEMGISEPKEMENLVSILPPDYVLMTKLSSSHIENFHNFEHLAYEKAQILMHPQTKVAFLTANSPFFDYLMERGLSEKISYGMEIEGIDYLGKQINSQQFECYYKNQYLLQACTKYLGVHNHQNLLGCIAVAHYLGVPIDMIQQSICSLTLPQQRLQQQEYQGISFINDTYNANIESMKAALDAISDQNPQGRKIAVLGAVVEQGKFNHEHHFEIGKYAATKVDTLFCYGIDSKPMKEAWEHAGKEVYYYESFSELTQAVKAYVQEKDHILVKGSRKYKMERLIEEFIK